MNLKAISQWLNKYVKPSTLENTYVPLNTLKIAKTIYPDGKKRMSLNGEQEWYGLQVGNMLAKKGINDNK
jgi:hypothetical protein